MNSKITVTARLIRIGNVRKTFIENLKWFSSDQFKRQDWISDPGNCYQKYVLGSIVICNNMTKYLIDPFGSILGKVMVYNQ